MLHALNSNSADWPTLIRNHVRELLRSGACTTFAEAKARVLADIRADTLARDGKEILSGGMVGKAKNGDVKGHGEGGESLALPKEVVTAGLKETRTALEEIVEIGS